MPQYPVPQYQPPMPPMPQMPVAKAAGGTAKTAKMLFLLCAGVYFVMCFYEKGLGRSIDALESKIACLSTQADCPQPPTPPVEPVPPLEGMKGYDDKNKQYENDRKEYETKLEKYNKDEKPAYLRDVWEWKQDYNGRVVDVPELASDLKMKQDSINNWGYMRHTIMYLGLGGMLLGLIGIMFTGSDVEKAAAVIGAALGIIPRL